jgi:hypothetical protein
MEQRKRKLWPWLITHIVAIIVVSLLMLRSDLNGPQPSVKSAETQGALRNDLGPEAVNSLFPTVETDASGRVVTLKNGRAALAYLTFWAVLTWGIAWSGWRLLKRARWSLVRLIGAGCILAYPLFIGVVALAGVSMLARSNVQMVTQDDGVGLTANARGESYIEQFIPSESDLRIVRYRYPRRNGDGTTTEMMLVWSTDAGVEGLLLNSFSRPSLAADVARFLSDATGLPNYIQREGEDAELVTKPPREEP